ncbi:MAG: GGDEF domain-containing protein [Myxococcales bacterium]|nr:GGDEF domain-containing protein [Myxococcales bacterium]MCB9536500.1 GGDEF domain-containing protein [Myxococcales bacterium]
MSASPAMNDQLEDMQRKLAFAEACGDPLDFNGLLARASSLLFKWGQADVVTLILPPESPGLEPVLHVCGRQPVLPLAERSVRDECALLLADMDFAHLPGEAFRLHRGPELTPLHGAVRDDYLYRFWSQPLEVGGEVVGVVALFGFTDWILAPRVRRLLTAFGSMLAGAVRNAIAVDQLRSCAVYDDLTGVFNRRGLRDALVRETARAQRVRSELSLMLIDLDHFKTINDTYGHPEGDRVLQAVAAALHGEVRTTDAIGRLGGDEFVVLLPDTGPAMAQRVGERLAARLQSIGYGDGQTLSISMGLAAVDPRAADAVDAALQRADEALYEAKRGGRGRIAQGV